MSSRDPLFFKKNIELLTRLYPRFRQEILDHYKASPELLIKEGSAGLPTALLHGRYLHSRHNPEREADRLVGQVCGDIPGIGVFLGFGLGYQIEAFRKRFPDSVVILVEKDPALFLSALSSRNMGKIFSGPVSLLLDSPPEEIVPLLEQFPEKHIHIVRLQAAIDNSPGYYEKVEEFARVGVSRRKVNTATLQRFGRRWIRNLALNIETMETAGDVGSWAKVLAGIPAFIAAAGPSLDDTLPFLETIRRKAVIISSDTAARFLLKRGIQPDFIILVDPQYWNTRHLDGLDLSGSILISEPATHPKVFHESYREIFLSASIFPLGTYLEPEGRQRHTLGAGGSVATTAWDFGRLLGARPLFLSGLDLGFPDGRTHFRGSYFEERIRSLNTRFKPHEHGIFRYLHSGFPFFYEDFDGNRVLTDKRLEVYRQWFEEQLRSGTSANHTFTLSRRGVRILGVETEDVEVFRSLPDRRDEIDAKINACLNQHSRHREENSGENSVAQRVQRLRQELLKLKDLSAEGLRTVEQTQQISKRGETAHAPFGEASLFIKGTMRETQLLKKLDLIDHRILNMAERRIAAFLITPILQEIESRAGQTGSMEENLDLSFHIYSELASAVEFHLDLFSIRNTVKELAK
jgi:hypothetical protein